MSLRNILFVLIILQSCQAADKSANKMSAESILEYAHDSDRFIAHAGGQIEGFTYTNSLEALNSSYIKGFRRFELDIIKTSDGHFVAAHDWGKWQKITGYTGLLPPTKSQFLNEKIFNKFTPLSMTEINQWFISHPDSILVTDKVKDVSAFSNKFIDKNRLVMEVFNWKELKKGISLGIKSVLPTGNLLKKYHKGNVGHYLVQLGITEAAVSRKFIVKEPLLMSQLQSAGIKIFAFHVNHKKGTGTDYMICYESHIFYGFYANNWNLNWQPKCNQPD